VTAVFCTLWLLLLAQDPDDQAAGIKALEAQKYDEAVALFTKAVAADPKDYAAHFHLALAYSLSGNDARAIPEYKTALDLQPGLYEAEMNLGISLVRMKDPAGAVPHLQAAVAKKPNQFRPAYFLGEALLSTNANAEAEKAFQAAQALQPNSAPTEIGWARAIARQGRVADAEPHFRKAAALDAGNRDALLELAELYESARQPAPAIAIYREFPQNPGAQERMGALLLSSGHPDEAIAPLESAVAKSPTSANRVALAQAYARTKQPDKAAAIVTPAIAAAPQDLELRMFYGRLLRDQRKLREAAAQFLAVVQAKKDSVEAWNELAGVLIVDEQYPQAIAALDRVEALGAATSGHHYLRAIALDHLHQNKEALVFYEKFLAESRGKSPDEEFKARQRVRILQAEKR
jgi:tetratricopeptide (TPR) repeat protein